MSIYEKLDYIEITYDCPPKINAILESLVEQGFFKSKQEAIHNFVYEGLKRDGVIQFGRDRTVNTQKDLFGQKPL